MEYILVRCANRRLRLSSKPNTDALNVLTANSTYSSSSLRHGRSFSYESRNKENMAMNNSAERPRAPRSLSDTSTSTMVRDIIVKDHRGQDKFMHARLDCGADANFMSKEKALILGHKLERYSGPDFNMGIGQLQPIYQIYVTWTFNLPDKRSSKSFDDHFLVVKGAMFDVILGEMVLFGKQILLKNPEFFFLTINPIGKGMPTDLFLVHVRQSWIQVLL